MTFLWDTLYSQLTFMLLPRTNSGRDIKQTQIRVCQLKLFSRLSLWLYPLVMTRNYAYVQAGFALSWIICRSERCLFIINAFVYPYKIIFRKKILYMQMRSFQHLTYFFQRHNIHIHNLPSPNLSKINSAGHGSALSVKKMTLCMSAAPAINYVNNSGNIPT